jgi:hypothetical protein
MSGFESIPGMRYEMTLRCDRPLQGCEITPNVHCYLRGGQTDNATRAKIMEANPHYFTYHWARGKYSIFFFCMIIL